MEVLLRKLNSQGTTLDTDTRIRLETRPSRSNSNVRALRGRTVDDYGSTLLQSASNKHTNPTLIKQLSRPAPECEKASDDELDFLTPANRPVTPLKRIKPHGSNSGSRSTPNKTNFRDKSTLDKSKTSNNKHTPIIRETHSKRHTESRDKISHESHERRQPSQLPTPGLSDINARHRQPFPEIPPLSNIPLTPSPKRSVSRLPVSPIVRNSDDLQERNRHFPPEKLSTKSEIQLRKLPQQSGGPSKMQTRSSKPFPMPPPFPKRLDSRCIDKPSSILDILSEPTKGGTAEAQNGSRKRPFPMAKELLEASLTNLENVTQKDKCEAGVQKWAMDASSSPTVESIFPDVSDEGEDDSFFLNPRIDPSTLCPYCDSPLPATPTPHLKSLLNRAATHPRSHADPRPSNPLGRKAPLMVFVGVCQRHEFENVWLPEARQKGWKEEIDWDILPKRIKKMKHALSAILNDTVVDDSKHETGEWNGRKAGDGFHESGCEKTQWGPRKKCVFWREMLTQARKTGMKAVGGVKSQYDTFEKVQPGYYGELGSVIIHQTLFALFPPTSIPFSTTRPLSPSEFIQRILVPQVGLLLIQDDLQLSVQEALQVMRASVQYGVAMFPHGGDDDDDASKNGTKMGVADRMMMEQVRRRRKELEAEEKQEAEVFERELSQERGRGRLK